MKKASVYRTVIILTLAALVGLLGLQVYWFANAYAIQEKQFDRTVSLALRQVADRLLALQGDFRQRIAPVRQGASNTFYVTLGKPASYRVLDSLLRNTFLTHDVHAPFELAIYSVQHDETIIAGDSNRTHAPFDRTVSRLKKNEPIIGNYYQRGALTPEDAACMGRDELFAAIDFSITFPRKQADIVGGMSIWIFTAVTCVAILIVFGFLLIQLSRQKKLAEVKADFINNMTHELQTPVANIAMASEVLTQASATGNAAKVMQYAGIIHKENQRLRFHIEQVLHTAQLDRGEVTVHKKRIDIHALIQEVTRTFEVRVQQRAGSLQKDLQASPAWVQADPDHIAQVLYNLLDNADKYSQRQPEIIVSTRNHEAGIVVSVADRGIGIRYEEQKLIFDKFYRAPTGNRHDVKGFGLGLAYVQHIMNAHAGHVRVSSEEHQGSRFDLIFQIA
jgi:two-component system, OmpR family, phosphate regulon sensor histidine kinase PhoR